MLLCVKLFIFALFFIDDMMILRKSILGFVLVALVGCNYQRNHVYDQLVAIDSLLVKEQADSALYLLEHIELTGSDDECMAYYHLLSSQTRYKCYLPIESDSVIRLSVDYYRKSGDKGKLAKALLYDGCILYVKGKMTDGMKVLKEAETIVEEVPDDILRHNVYFAMASINFNCGEKELALDYIRKATACSFRSGRSDHLAFDYQNSSVYHYSLGNDDSCKYYIDKCVSLIDYLPAKPAIHRAKVWKSIGFAYFSIDKQRSKEFLEKAISLAPIGDAYGALAKIYLEKKDTTQAKTLLLESIKDYSVPIVRIENILLLSKVEQQQGNYRRAAELAQQFYQLSDSLNKRQREDNIRAQQIAFDRQTEAERAAVVRRWLWMVIGLAVLIGGVAVVILMRRSQRTKRLLDEEQRRTETLNQENRKVSRELNKTMGKVEQMKRARQELERLSLNQQREWQRHEQAIERGHRLFMELTGGGNTKQWGREDFKDFRTYYDTVDSAFAETMARQYGQLSSNLYLLAVLEHIGKSDDDIMAAMALSLGALRTTRSRLNQKQQDV